MKKDFGSKTWIFPMPVLMIAKLQPLCFDTCAHAYNVVGEKIAAAFSCGKEIGKN